MANLDKKLIEMIEKVVIETGNEVYSIDYDDSKEDKVLTILIDSEKGIDLDKCVEVSEKISLALDNSTYLKDAYILEVASAGVERPLQSLEQYNKAIDKYIQVHTTKLYEGYDELVGYLRESDEKHIILEIKIKTRTIKLDINREDIIDAMTTVKI